MNDMYAHVTIRILEKEYHVACPAEERADLIAAAERLNNKMREIRDTGRVVGLDRIAIMAALNMSAELQKTQHQDQELREVVGHRLKNLGERLDQALGSGHQLEL